MEAYSTRRLALYLLHFIISSVNVCISMNDLSVMSYYSGAGIIQVVTDCGAEFFGLAHPTVQYLIQSCAGARKCVNYRCARFELSRSEADAYCEEDASVNASLFERLSAAGTSVTTTLSEQLQIPVSTAASCRPTIPSTMPFS